MVQQTECSKKMIPLPNMQASCFKLNVEHLSSLGKQSTKKFLFMSLNTVHVVFYVEVQVLNFCFWEKLNTLPSVFPVVVLSDLKLTLPYII